MVPFTYGKAKVSHSIFLSSILMAQVGWSAIRCEEVFAQSFHELSLLKKSPFGGRTRYQLNYHKSMERLFEIYEASSSQMKVKVAYYVLGRPVYRLDLFSSGVGKKVLITSGVHGNEGIGPAVLLELLPFILSDPFYRQNFQFTIYLNINPQGLLWNLRNMVEGGDWNRSFVKEAQNTWVVAFKNSLQGEKFDLSLDLHESSYSKGFFIIKSARSLGVLARTVLTMIPSTYLVQSPNGFYPFRVFQKDYSEKVRYQFERPGLSESYNEGTLKDFLASITKDYEAYTLESATNIELKERISVYKEMILAFVENLK